MARAATPGTHLGAAERRTAGAARRTRCDTRRSCPRPGDSTRDERGGRGLSAPFRRGVAALAQYLQREGHERPVPRKHEEPVDIDGQEHVVKLGVFISNTKSRRNRLTPEQRQALTELGVQWAA
ncbi:helicase associated domain-containing protein [Streptomyces sp. NBC_00654]|uniref:helicase associated domain-containing protein n=1 Tax=Streptomyces sp. NBC_00654 TaxID=2975799 RepID=UPI002254EE8C|nr:helicase associated domain-containing protein [Streptomyces sp. NBC_00654]MCX4970900.1 helicase associated domain-containing protein [Streptomyces sp. NBC_00654]